MADSIIFVHASNIGGLTTPVSPLYSSDMMDKFYNPEINVIDGGVVRLWDVVNRWRFPNLSAPFWRLYWDDLPGAQVRLEGRDYPLLPEEVMLISPNTTVASSCDDERTTQLNIHFLVEPPYASVAPGVFMFSLKPNLKALVDEVFALSAAGEGAPDRRYSMLFLRIILAALMELPEDSLSKHPLDPRIDAAMRLLRQGRQQAVDNQELAKRAGLSLNAFLRLFRQQAGTSPQKYQRQCRVEQACLLLHYSDLNIEEIAEKTGFCDRYHFSRIFKSLRGTGPAGFRKLIAPSG